MPGERLPEQDPDRPHVRGGAGLVPMQPLRRDVRERAGHVADGRERVGVGHQGQPEVEEPHRDAVLLGEQHVRRLHVAVNDPARVCEGETFEHLRGRFDGALVAELVRAQRLPQRVARDVLVRDVQVLVVGLEPVRAQAVRVAQRRRRLGLALGPRRGAALPRDDLQRELLTAELVADEPDRPGAAAAERAQGPIAVQDETVRGDGFDGARQRCSPLAPLLKIPAPTGRSDTVTRLRALMSERDDIEFDFFEEPDTRETPEERPRRGPRPPVRPPTGLTPLLRLIGLISFAILIVLLLVLWVNGCRENKRKDAYRHYVEKVQTYGQQSQRLGRNFNALLTTRGTRKSDVESELSGLARQQEQIASAARGLDAPGRLRNEDAHMLDALDLRTNGLRGMPTPSGARPRRRTPIRPGQSWPCRCSG